MSVAPVTRSRAPAGRARAAQAATTTSCGKPPLLVEHTEADTLGPLPVHAFAGAAAPARRRRRPEDKAAAAPSAAVARDARR